MNNAAEHRVIIAMPRARAWEKLRDLGLAHNYVPGLVRTEITTGVRTGVGASRRVYQSETRFLDETVIDWGEGHGFVIRLHQGNKGAPAPFSEATFRYWLDDAEDGNTSLCTTLAYTVRWGLLGRLLDRLVLAKAIRSSTRDVAICLKDFYERGVALDPTRLRELKQHRA